MFSIPNLFFILSLPIAILALVLTQNAEWRPHLQVWLSSFSHPTVILPQGTLLGTVLAKDFPPVEAFLGIPYVLPPVGDRRFRHPVPVSPSNETIYATSFGSKCPGAMPLLKVPAPESEDCLTANVFRPKQYNTKEPLPVAVYIHGGAFNRGSATMHNTASMVGWSESPFIAVSFNYRIGALGFLPSTVTAKEGILNLGLHDQVVLLEWVRDNIGKFGGDPNQVTLFGLSAGAHSIGHHLMNYKPSSPLFHRVIIESGAPTSRAVHKYDNKIHEEQFRAFLEEAGCSAVPDDEITSCLRARPYDAITKASDVVFRIYNTPPRWAFQPVVDGDLLPRRPIDAWEAGIWNKIPIMTGFNTNEGSMYVPSTMETPAEFSDFFRLLLPAFPESDIQAISNLYPDPSTDASSPYTDTRPIPVGAQYKRVEAAYAQYAYICPVRQTAHLATTAHDQPPVYLYHWAVNTTVKNGANHADNMYYESLDPKITSISHTQKELAGVYHAYLTSFIATGDPNHLEGKYKHRPVWEGYRREQPRKIVFGLGNDERAGGEGKGIVAEMVDDVWGKVECEFWWDRIGLSEQ
ncbi:MAG: hypothetical protein M1834_001182 [Cirrosporium novae-zelandiae]|nr:MAG: hypothetical protein M1834_001182 [Cirrosporium novae-zelandiae]